MIGVITTGGVAILVTAGATFITAVGGFVLGLTNRGRISNVTGTLYEVRELANGAQQALRNRCAQLEAHIRASGGEPPPDPTVHG